jgi:hypothetical protein
VVAGTRLAEGHDEVGPQGEIAAPEHAKPNFAVMHEAGTKQKVYYRPFCRRWRYVTNRNAPCW